LKIAILSCFHPYRGGIAQFNACIFEELSKDNIVKAFNFKRQYPDFLFPGKTQYVTKDDVAVSMETCSLLDTVNPFSYVKTLSAIREWGPDMLIVRYWMSFFAPSLGFITRHVNDGRKGQRCKVISILDNVIPHERHFFDTPLTKYFLTGSDGYVTLCKAVSEDLLKLKPDARFKVIPHPLYSHFGINMARTEAEERLGLEHGKKNLLFFGLIREYKGLDILLEAFSQLDDSYQLIIAGEPYGSFDKYGDLIDRMSGKDRVHCYLNYIKDSEVSLYFSAADLAVLPYRSATQSGISSVAYHFGIPMIVTSVGGLKEANGDKGTGICVEKAEPEHISRAIDSYFSDKSCEERFKNNIREEKKRLSWESFCKDLLIFAETL